MVLLFELVNLMSSTGLRETGRNVKAFYHSSCLAGGAFSHPTYLPFWGAGVKMGIMKVFYHRSELGHSLVI